MIVTDNDAWFAGVAGPCTVCGTLTKGLQCSQCRKGDAPPKPKFRTEPKKPYVPASAEVVGGALLLTLPIPGLALQPNGRANPFSEARERKAYREMVCRVVQQTRFRPMWSDADVHFAFFFPCARKRDKDNAIGSMKPGLDGLQDAGVVVNDSGLVPHPPTLGIDRERPRVELRISEASAYRQTG